VRSLRQAAWFVKAPEERGACWDASRLISTCDQEATTLYMLRQALRNAGGVIERTMELCQQAQRRLHLRRKVVLGRREDELDCIGAQSLSRRAHSAAKRDESRCTEHVAPRAEREGG
jgi:hypothetical protein